ncbi:hypothetical protein VTK73DRAFT_8063 [Phialemonium thermophilum]|uniref:Intradiol ring-cleavage dioxygenases domain-containing protein n=1 Tax=Phialemonium thermophilum TaxID=223376 RepID=A0ABR3XQ22_9PEZI
MTNLRSVVAAALTGLALLNLVLGHPAQLLRQERGISDKPMIARRDQEALDKWINTCHDQGAAVDYSLSTPETTIFTSNATSALTPETIIGPYFVEGEFIRSDITEGQDGIPIHLDIQFIDVNTCEPVTDMLVDVWHANATGYYSGVESQAGLNTTFLRGVQVTDHDGVTQFDSIYPGHYVGRTLHIHVVTRRGGQILPNGTYTRGTVNHIGQLYFDQELNNAVEELFPYNTNQFPRTSNVGDFLTADEATADYDPFVDYIRLSDDANDGLLMWITIGINTTADYDSLAMAAAHYYKEGGKSNTPNFNFTGFPFPGGNLTGNFTFPGNFTGFNFSGLPPFPAGGGFPGFPSPTPTAAPSVQPWGPCLKKREA